MRALAVAAVLLVALGPVADIAAQAPLPSRAMQDAIARARATLDRGDGAAARTLLDSLVHSAGAGTPDLAEALFWRAATAENIAAAERDWRRLTIELPLANRTSDALLRLAELEALRGHRKDARDYADRLLRDHAASPNAARALLVRAQTLLADNELALGCDALGALRANLPAGATELELQAGELAPRCAVKPGAKPEVKSDAAKAVTRPAAGAGADTAARAASGKPVTAPPVGAPPTEARTSGTETGRYSVQLAAYARLADAEALVKRLAAQGIDARVDGTVNPFRVRTGRYATRADAAARLAELKKRGHDGFIAEITP